MQPIMNERTPQALADQLDGLLQLHQDDSDVCRPIRIAREQLRVISWNRYAARHMHRDKVASLTRRHKGHKSIKEGRVHA